MVTAGHCFDRSKRIHNYSNSIPRGIFSTASYMGFVDQRAYTQNGIDAELIFTSASSLVWTGYTYGAVRAGLTGATGSPFGAQVCHSGAFEGEVCGFTVDANGCIDETVPRLCNEIHTTSNNRQGVGEGDSGGPILQRRNGGTYVAGIVSISTDGPEERCNNWYPQEVRRCFANFWYTDWTAISNKWGLRVNTRP